VSSPLHSSRPHYFDDDADAGNPDWDANLYDAAFEIPAEGGIYEFDCPDDQFCISKVLDSTMPLPYPHTHYDCRCSYPINHFRIIEDEAYHGSFYSITCYHDDHTWVLEIYPLKAESDSQRELWVLMRSGANVFFSFCFTQSNEEYTSLPDSDYSD